MRIIINAYLEHTHTQNIFTLFVDILDIVGYSNLTELFDLCLTVHH